MISDKEELYRSLLIKKKRRGLDDLYFFNKYIIEQSEERRRLIVPHVHGEWSHWLKNSGKRIKLLLVPRASHKSTFLTVGGALQAVCGDRNHRILIANATLPNSQRFLGEIKNHLKDNKLLKELYGEFYDKELKWNETEIEVKGRDVGTREATITACGVGGNLISQHYSQIYADDLVNAENSATRLQAAKVIDWWRRAFSLLDPNGSMFIIGCLTADSTVLMADGTWKRIVEVRVGEYVWSLDVNTRELKKKRVEAMIPQGKARVVTVKTKRHSIECTPNHPFLVLQGGDLQWRRADELKKRDFVVTVKQVNTEITKRWYGLRPERVVEIEKGSEKEVFDLTVADTHNFISEGYVVHNTRFTYFELYSYILDEMGDQVDHYIHSIYNSDGSLYFPEKYNEEKVEELKKLHGSYLFCNPYEAPVLMSNWSFKPIGEVRVGDEVIGWRVKKSGRRELCPNKVIATNSRLAKTVKMKMESGREIRCTPQHKWWTQRFKTNKEPFRKEYKPAKVGSKLKFICDPEIQNQELRGGRFVQRDDRVVSIKDYMEEEVFALQTETGNYIVWGYGSSNSAFYLNNPIDEETCPFKKEHIQYYDKPPAPLEIFSMCDPAVSQDVHADFSAIVTVGVDPQDHWYVLETLYGRWQTSELISNLFDVYQRFSPTTMTIELIGLGQAILEPLHNEEGRRKVYLPMVDIKSRTDVTKQMRVRSVLQPRFEALKIHIKREMTELEEEIVRFPKAKRDDLIDALADCTEIAFAPDPQKPANPKIASYFESQLRETFVKKQEYVDDVLGEWF